MVGAALESVARTEDDAKPGVSGGVVQAVLNAVEYAGDVGKEVADMLVRDEAGLAGTVLRHSLREGGFGKFQLAEGIFQLFDIVAGVLHGLFQFIHALLLVGEPCTFFLNCCLYIFFCHIDSLVILFHFVVF